MILKADAFVDELVDMNLNFDGHIPFCVKFYGHESYSKLYWRVGGGQNMLEISVHPEDRMLSSITLVNINKNSIFEEKNNSEKILESSSNIPVFCLNIWKNDGFFSDRFCDNFDLAVKVFLSNNSIMIKIGVPEGKVNFARYSDRFYLGLMPDKSISTIFLKDLSSKEIETFLSCVS